MAANKSVASARPAARAGAGNTLVTRARKYLSEVTAELRKTNWPTRAELIAQTQVVMGLLVIIGVFIASWDWVLSQILRGLLRLLGAERG